MESIIHFSVSSPVNMDMYGDYTIICNSQRVVTELAVFTSRALCGRTNCQHYQPAWWLLLKQVHTDTSSHEVPPLISNQSLQLPNHFQMKVIAGCKLQSKGSEKTRRGCNPIQYSINHRYSGFSDSDKKSLLDCVDLPCKLVS